MPRHHILSDLIHQTSLAFFRYLLQFLKFNPRNVTVILMAWTDGPRSKTSSPVEFLEEMDGMGVVVVEE